MPATYTLIETVTVTSGTPSTILFSNIPQTYDDLLIKMSMRTNESGVYYSDTDITFNGESSRRWNGFYSVNNTASGSGTTAFNIIGVSTAGNTTSNVFSNVEIYIPNYKSSDNKIIGSTGAQENDSVSNNGISCMSNKIVNGTAITSIELDPFNGTLVIHSSASLYGISKS
jgi:hypothetical protein